MKLKNSILATITRNFKHKAYAWAVAAGVALGGISWDAQVAQAQALEPHVEVSDSSFTFRVRSSSLASVLDTARVTLNVPAGAAMPGRLFLEQKGNGPALYTILSDTIAPATLILGFTATELARTAPGDFVDTLVVRADGARRAYIVVNVHVDSAMSLKIVKPGDTTAVTMIESIIFAGEAPRDSVFDVINPEAPNGGGLINLVVIKDVDSDKLSPLWLDTFLSSTLSPAKLTVTLSDKSLKAGDDSTATFKVATDSAFQINGNPTSVTVKIHVHGPRGTLSLNRSSINISTSRVDIVRRDTVVISNSGAGIASRFQGIVVSDTTKKPWLSMDLSRKVSPAVLRFSVNGSLMSKNVDTAIVKVSDPEALGPVYIPVIVSLSITPFLVSESDTVRLNGQPGDTVTFSRAVSSSNSTSIKGLSVKASAVSGSADWLSVSVGSETPTNIFFKAIVPSTKRVAQVELVSSTPGIAGLIIPVVTVPGTTVVPDGPLLVSGDTSIVAAPLASITSINWNLNLNPLASLIVTDSSSGALSVSLNSGVLHVTPDVSDLASNGIRTLFLSVKKADGTVLGKLNLRLIVAPVISANEALAGLGTGGGLTSAQAARLDWLGNRNGRVDIGDITKQILLEK